MAQRSGRCSAPPRARARARACATFQSRLRRRCRTCSMSRSRTMEQPKRAPFGGPTSPTSSRPKVPLAFPRRLEGEPALGMELVVVGYPMSDCGECGLDIRGRAEANIVALECLCEHLCDAVALRAFHWREAGLEVRRGGDVDGLAGGIERAIVGQPLDGMGSTRRREPVSTHPAIRSRIISPEMPSVVASQPMTSRSWQSSTKAMRTSWPLQHVNSRLAEHQWMLECRMTARRSCSRDRRRPVQGASGRRCICSSADRRVWR